MATIARNWIGGVVTLALAAFAASPALSEATVMRLSRGYGMLYMPMIVIQEKKLLEKHAAKMGLGEVKTEWFLFDGGNVINDAMMAGTLDIAGTGAPGFVTLWSKARGIPAAEVIGVSGMSSTALEIITNNPAVKSLADFGPKDKIAMPGIKTSLAAVILQMISAKTYGKENFAKFDSLTVGIPHPEAVAALLSGRTEITAHFASPPFIYVELQNPNMRSVLRAKDVLGNITFDVIFAPKRFVNANPKLVEAFLAAQEEANELIARNPEEAAQIYVRASKVKVDEAEIVKILKDPDTRYSSTPTDMMAYAEHLAMAGTIKRKPTDWKDMYISNIHNKPGS